MRSLRVLGLLFAPALLFFSSKAGAAKQQPKRVKQTAKPIWAIAMDGSRVAYMTTGRRVAVWNVSTGATSEIKGTYPSTGSRFGRGLGEVAIAGERVALITRFVVGNSQQTQERLYIARLGGTAHQLGKPANHFTDPVDLEGGDPGFATGRWIAGVVGSGKTLAVSTWKSDKSVSSDERLDLITADGLRPIASGPGAIVAESASSGHIAVLRSTGAWPAYDVGPTTTAPTVGIYSRTGTLLTEIAHSSARQVALSGNRLVVVTETKTLEVYDATTGALVQTWPVVTGWPRQQAGRPAISGRLAVYPVSAPSAGPTRTLHLLDLMSGKDVVIARSATGSFDAAMSSRGLVYAVNSRKSGKLAFVPTAKLLADLG